ncbi:hypothetical protein JXB02_04195 [Candidatus Woesearchaeota archaeon]|nr:hypothetical protein [Candidatus Woesearchaeota archaeon]
MNDEGRPLVRHVVRGIIYSTDPTSGEPRFLILHNRDKRHWQNNQGGVGGIGEVMALHKRPMRKRGQGVEIGAGSRAVLEYEALRKGRPRKVVFAAFTTRTDMTTPLEMRLSEDDHDRFGWIDYPEMRRWLTRYPEQIMAVDAVIRKSKVLQQYIEST